MKSGNITRILYILFFILGITIIFLVLNEYDLILQGDSADFSGFEDFIASMGIFGPIVFFIIIVLEVIVTPIPGTPLYIIGGSLFGTLFGGFLVLGGNILGAIICFKLARKLGRHYVEKFVHKENLERVNRLLQNHGGLFIFFIRLNPITTSDLFSYAAGLTKIKFSAFFWATFFALLPYAFFPSLLGEYLTNIDPRLIFIFFAIIIIYLITYFLRKLYKQKKKDTENNK
jgi:uncharacterized membrane protein YdjX (TVP38/TMEM64 family)